MSHGVAIKFTYFHSGYSRYTKKEIGCKNHHPSDDCTVPECREACPNRHPKKCKFEDRCKFQSRCSYKHLKEVFKRKRERQITKRSQIFEGRNNKTEER